MTKPTSRLNWLPDPVNPLALRAAWVGAGWHYTLEWGHLTDSGEPAQDAMMWWDPPVYHLYPRAGRFTLIGRPGLPNSSPVSTVVTLRTKLKPEPRFELLEDGRSVRASLERHDDDVRYRIDWGDHTVTEHDVNDLAPVHQYSPGIGKPTITVHDLPAKRQATFVGPEIPEPPPPEAEPRMQFRTTTGKPEWMGMLELFGFPPRTTVDLGPAGSYTYDGLGGQLTPPGQVTTDANGYASREYKLLEDKWQFDDWWQVYARWTDPTTQRWRQMWLPIQWCEYAGGPGDDPTEVGPCWRPIVGGEGTPRNPCNQFPLLVDWDIPAPHVITLFTATPGPQGDWSVDWGDGTTETVAAPEGRLRATRNYGGIKNVWVTVTRPDGRVARRRLRQMEPRFETWKDGSLAIFWQYEEHINEPPCTLKDCDPYTVVRIDSGDGRPLQQRARPSLHCPERSGNGISYAAPGTYQVAVYAPMSVTRYGTHVQKTRGHGEGEFEIREEQPAPNPLTQTFHVGDTTKPGRYTARFEITNSAEGPVPWQLEFTLAAPAVLADVQSWVGTATKHDLGGGRWRITCDAPARPRDPFPVEITVQPCGNPRIWPTGITLTVPPS